ncbi:hypothetical protein MPER_02465 [Moniliophthora perniciosa FA553]|nr:hypothetical protein MPER_02465 [Moniliophthora perniciosa FA553]
MDLEVPKPNPIQPNHPDPNPSHKPAVEAALAAAQFKSADDILKSLRQPKPPPKAQAQPQKTKTQLKIQPKKPQPLFETDAGMEMKEEAALEPEKKADEAPVKEEGAKGRFQRFLGGWF